MSNFRSYLIAFIILIACCSHVRAERLWINIMFDRMDTVLNNEDNALLDTIANSLTQAPAQVLEKYPEINLEIRGHCDVVEWQKDTTLSLRRANAVRNYLIGKGVPKERLTVVNYGIKELVNNCGIGKPCSENEQALNRRVSFKLINRKEGKE